MSHCLFVSDFHQHLAFPTLYSASINYSTLPIVLFLSLTRHLPRSSLYSYSPSHHRPPRRTPSPPNTANMTPNQENKRLPRNPRPNRVAFLDDSPTPMTTMLTGMFSPPNLPSAQEKPALATPTLPQTPPRLGRPPPVAPSGNEYPRYPGPQRVVHEGYLAATMNGPSFQSVYASLPPPKRRPVARVVDGCELARQEREMIIKAMRRVPSEEVRNREYQKRKAMRLKEASLVPCASPKRKMWGQGLPDLYSITHTASRVRVGILWFFFFGLYFYGGFLFFSSAFEGCFFLYFSFLGDHSKKSQTR